MKDYRRSITFPVAIWKRVETIRKMKPHLSVNAIVIEYLQQGLDKAGAGLPSAMRKDA